MDDPAVARSSPLQRFALAINFFFPALALVVLALRLYGKTNHKTKGPGTFRHPSTLLGLDDGLACLSMSISIALTIASYFWIKTNFVGILAAEVPPHDLVIPCIWTYIVQILYYPVLALIKSSVLVFLLRLGGQTPRLRIAIYALNGLNLALMFAIFGVSAGQCTPISFHWDPTVPGGRCINQPVFYLVQSGLNIVTDVFTLGVPIWIFLGTKMGRRLKIVTLYVFFLGLFITLIGVARFVFLYMLFYSDARFMEHYSVSFTLSAVETNLAIVCACAPTLRGLLRSWFPRALGAAGEYNETGDLDPYVDAKSSSAAGDRGSVRQSKKCVFGKEEDGGDELFGYPKDGRGRVLCSRAEVEGLGLTASEEEIMTCNRILKTTDVVIEQEGDGDGDVSSLARTSTEGTIILRGSREHDRESEMEIEMEIDRGRSRNTDGGGDWESERERIGIGGSGSRGGGG